MALTATLGLLLLGSAAQTTTTSGQSGIAMATGTTSTTHMTTRTAYQILVVSARARMVMAGNSSAQALVDAFVYDPAVERAFATGIASGFEDLSPDSVSIRGVSPVASSRRLSQKERRLDSMARVDVAMGITLPASSATARMLQSNPDLLTSVLEVTLDEINRAFSLLPAHSSTNFASIEVSAVSNRLAMNDGSANTQASQGREFQCPVPEAAAAARRRSSRSPRTGSSCRSSPSPCGTATTCASAVMTVRPTSTAHRDGPAAAA